MAKDKAEKPVSGDTDDSEESPKSGGKKKLIVIGAVALILIAGGGAGAYFFLGRSEPPAEQEVAEEPALPVEAKPILVPVKTVVAPLIEKGSVVGYVYFDLNIEVADEEVAQKLNDQLPVLRDLFARNLYDTSIADPKSPGRADIPAIQARLLEDARRTYGAEAIKQIYVAQVKYTGL